MKIKFKCGDKVTEETRYFISSLDANDPKPLERVVRVHWTINTLQIAGIGLGDTELQNTKLLAQIHLTNL